MPDHAVIGYVHGGTVRSEFCASLIGTMIEGKTPVDAVLTYQSGPNISTARNLVVDDFLTRQRAPWLLMADTDMVFAASALSRLVESASPGDRPIIGALCWSQNDGAADPHPTMYDLAENDDGALAFTRPVFWAKGAVRKVSATGAAFLLMHRDALAKIAASSGDAAAPWFRESAVGAPLSLMGEDLTFCLRAGAAGIPVFVNTAVQVGHVKPVMLGKVT